MIKIPSFWGYYSRCACVQLGEDDRFYICSVEVCSGTRAFYSLSPDVVVSSKRTVEDHFCNRQSYPVLLSPEENGNHRFVPLAESGEPSDRQCIRLWHPERIYSAVSVTFRGCYSNLRQTLSAIKSAATGKFFVKNCALNVEDSWYSLEGYELKKGHSGVVFVGPLCVTKINRCAADTPESEVPSLLGLDSQVKQVRDILRRSFQDFSTGAQYVLIHGPSGCGVHSILQKCLREYSKEICLLPWSPGFTPNSSVKGTSGKKVVLMVDPVELNFSVNDSFVTEMSRRLLFTHVSQLAKGHSVVVVGVTHNLKECCTETVGSIFRHSVFVSLPDAETRERIARHFIKSVEGLNLTEFVNMTSGQSCQEVIRAARKETWHTPRLFTTTWDSIRGLDAVKKTIMNALVTPQLSNRNAFSRFNIEPVKGILLYGPPGCSKTSIVKAICSENSYSLIYLDSARLISAYVGESERELRSVFEKAQQSAPCIVFFDEVEVIGTRRDTSTSNSGSDRLLTTLLTELDGFSSKKGVCFVGATNVPHLLDPALLRPGRLDSLIHVPLPSLSGRVEILRLYFSSLKCDYEEIAKHMNGFSGADIKSFCASVLLNLLDNKPSEFQAELSSNFVTQFAIESLKTFSRLPYDMHSITAFERSITH